MYKSCAVRVWAGTCVHTAEAASSITTRLSIHSLRQDGRGGLKYRSWKRTRARSLQKARVVKENKKTKQRRPRGSKMCMLKIWEANGVVTRLDIHQIYYYYTSMSSLTGLFHLQLMKWNCRADNYSLYSYSLWDISQLGQMKAITSVTNTSYASSADVQPPNTLRWKWQKWAV